VTVKIVVSHMSSLAKSMSDLSSAHAAIGQAIADHAESRDRELRDMRDKLVVSNAISEGVKRNVEHLQSDHL
jgi:hypothetical protein